MNNAEIAGIVRKLNGMKCGGAGITNQVLGFLSIYLLNRPMDHVTLGPKDLLAFCRAVVERVDGDVKTPESCGEYLKLSEKEKLQLLKQEASK